MRLTATEVLRRHVIERRLRASIRSANLDGDFSSAAPRMSEAAWVDSCQLVTGVPMAILDVLGVRECTADEATWDREAAEHLGVKFERHTEQVAKPPTLAQAASKLGLALRHADLRKMRLDAIQRVAENQLRRARAAAVTEGEGQRCDTFTA
jgi:hypothetical protein